MSCFDNDREVQTQRKYYCLTFFSVFVVSVLAVVLIAVFSHEPIIFTLTPSKFASLFIISGIFSSNADLILTRIDQPHFPVTIPDQGENSSEPMKLLEQDLYFHVFLQRDNQMTQELLSIEHDSSISMPNSSLVWEYSVSRSNLTIEMSLNAIQDSKCSIQNGTISQIVSYIPSAFHCKDNLRQKCSHEELLEKSHIYVNSTLLTHKSIYFIPSVGRVKVLLQNPLDCSFRVESTIHTTTMIGKLTNAHKCTIPLHQTGNFSQINFNGSASSCQTALNIHTYNYLWVLLSDQKSINLTKPCLTSNNSVVVELMLKTSPRIVVYLFILCTPLLIFWICLYFSQDKNKKLYFGCLSFPLKEKGFVEISGSDVPTHNHSNSKSDISRQNRHIPQESKAVETHFSRANYEPVFPSSEQPDEPISPNTARSTYNTPRLSTRLSESIAATFVYDEFQMNQVVYDEKDCSNGGHRNVNTPNHDISKLYAIELDDDLEATRAQIHSWHRQPLTSFDSSGSDPKAVPTQSSDVNLFRQSLMDLSSSDTLSTPRGMEDNEMRIAESPSAPICVSSSLTSHSVILMWENPSSISAIQYETEFKEIKREESWTEGVWLPAHIIDPPAKVKRTISEVPSPNHVLKLIAHLLPGKTYRFRVRVCTPDGYWSPFSPPSLPITTPASAHQLSLVNRKESVLSKPIVYGDKPDGSKINLEKSDSPPGRRVTSLNRAAIDEQMKVSRRIRPKQPLTQPSNASSASKFQKQITSSPQSKSIGELSPSQLSQSSKKKDPRSLSAPSMPIVSKVHSTHCTVILEWTYQSQVEIAQYHIQMLLLPDGSSEPMGKGRSTQKVDLSQKKTTKGALQETGQNDWQNVKSQNPTLPGRRLLANSSHSMCQEIIGLTNLAPQVWAVFRVRLKLSTGRWTPFSPPSERVELTFTPKDTSESAEKVSKVYRHMSMGDVLKDFSIPNTRRATSVPRLVPEEKSPLIVKGKRKNSLLVPGRSTFGTAHRFLLGADEHAVKHFQENNARRIALERKRNEEALQELRVFEDSLRRITQGAAFPVGATEEDIFYFKSRRESLSRVHEQLVDELLGQTPNDSIHHLQTPVMKKAREHIRMSITEDEIEYNDSNSVSQLVQDDETW